MKMLSNKKIICTSCPAYGHFIPVLTIAKHLSIENDVTFLIHNSQKPGVLKPNKIKQILQNYDIKWKVFDWEIHDPVANISMMKLIIREVSPDISICDWMKPFDLAVRLCNIKCRVSIIRAEQIVGYEIINKQLPKKFQTDTQIDIEKNNALLDKLKLSKIQDSREILIGDINIIPSIPELDVIPQPLPMVYRNTVVEHVGPLFLDLNFSTIHIKDWINQQKNSKRKIILVTLGTVYGDTFIYYWLLNSICNLENVSILLVIPNKYYHQWILKEFTSQENVIITDFVNLQEVLEYIDLCIHHCGHGLALTCLLSGTPSITIPTNEYDREDNAVRLEQMGVNLRYFLGPKRLGLKELVIQALHNQSMKAESKKLQKRVRDFMATKNTQFIDKLLFEFFNRKRALNSKI